MTIRAANLATRGALGAGVLMTAGALVQSAEGFSGLWSPIAAWALAPYVTILAASFLARSNRAAVVTLVLASLASALAVFAYSDGLLRHQSSTSALVFLFIPLYQNVPGYLFLVTLVVLRLVSVGPDVVRNSKWWLAAWIAPLVIFPLGILVAVGHSHIDPDTSLSLGAMAAAAAAVAAGVVSRVKRERRYRLGVIPAIGVIVLSPIALFLFPPWPRSKADSTLESIVATLVRIQIYAKAHGCLPQSLDQLPKRADRSSPIKDSWGRPLLYSVGSNGVLSLRSLGRDGFSGGEDDDRDIEFRYYTKGPDGRFLPLDRDWLQRDRVPFGEDPDEPPH